MITEAKVERCYMLISDSGKKGWRVRSEICRMRESEIDADLVGEMLVGDIKTVDGNVAVMRIV